MPPCTRAGSKAAAAAAAASTSATASATAAAAAAVTRPRVWFVYRRKVAAAATRPRVRFVYRGDGAAAPSRRPLADATEEDVDEAEEAPPADADAAEEAPPSSAVEDVDEAEEAPPADADAAEEAPPSSAVKIISPLEDNRSYRPFKLCNSLCGLLIMDPDTTHAAVCLGVGAGYTSDPDGLEGTAHLLQKSVLYCHEGYDDFSDLIYKNNGSILALTLPEETKFCFDVNHSVLSTALERFAQFFLKPKIIADISRETAPDFVTPTNPCVLSQLQRKFMSQPLSKYNSDNWKSVNDKANQKGLNILDELRKFHESFYSSTTMSLVLYSKASLDEMEGVVVKNFSALKKNLKDSFRLTSNPCTDEFRQILVKLSSLNGGNSLIVQWVLNRSILKREEMDACSYLCHVFGYNAEGSLFPVLKKLGWAMSAQAAETDCQSGFSVFTVSVELTVSGNSHCNEIVGLVFNYIKMLRRQGPRKYLFDKLQDARLSTFNSGIKLTPITHVSDIVSNMQSLPPSDWLIGYSVPTNYSTDAIKQILNQMNENTVRVFLISDKFERHAGSEESLSGMHYSCESLPLSKIEEWKSCAPTVNMCVPPNTKKVAKKKASTLPHSHPSHELDKASPRSNEEQAFAPPHSEQYLESNKVNFQLSEEQNGSRVCIIYDKMMEKHTPLSSDHPENPGRVRAIFKRLEANGLVERCVVYKSEPAKLKYLTEVHDDSYVVRIIKDSPTLTKNPKADMYYSKGSLNAILLSAGGAVKAAEMVASGKHPHAFAVVRPPGHHASAKQESGFCYFNNIAVAAKFLMKEYSYKKVLIIDWDIHFGDGTSDIFKSDENVLFVSMHRYPYEFPETAEAAGVNVGFGKGKGFNCNICWKEEGIGDSDLFAVFDHIVMPLGTEFDPDIILISGGFDAALGDTVGDCCVTPAGYACVLEKLLRLKKGVVIVLEGGYNHDVTAECCCSCIKVLCGDCNVEDSSIYHPLDSTWDTILTLRKFLQPHWSCFNSDIPVEVLARRRSPLKNPKVLARRRSTVKNRRCRRPIKDGVT